MTLLARYEAGDKTRLSLRNSVYADVSDAPKSLSEALNVINSATMEFNSLPVDIKRFYNFSAAEFISDYGSQRMQNLFKAYNSNIKIKKDIPSPGTSGSGLVPGDNPVLEVKKDE